MHLRTLIVSAGLVLAIHGTATAQGEFGVKGGASFGNISNKGLLPGSLKTRTGGAGGLYFGYRAAVIGFGAEAMYAQRGAKTDEAIGVASTRLDYIDIPAYLKVTIPAPGVHPFVYAGPQVSFEVRCKTASGGGDCADDRSKTDYAGVIGAGLRLGGDSFGFTLEGRYVYGLKDLKLNTVTSSDSYKNRTFMLLVGIGI